MKRLIVLSVAGAAMAFAPAVFAQTTSTSPQSERNSGAGGFQPYAGGASGKPNSAQTNPQTNSGAGGFQPYAGGASGKPGQHTSGDATATPQKSQ
jgi:hypothetical protein